MKLEAIHISHGFWRSSRFVPVLADLHVQIDSGDFLVIRGRSGSGKTTLLSILIGLLRPQKGTVCCAGKNIFALRDHEACDLRNQCIGYAAQQSTLLESLSVLDNVRLAAHLQKSTKEKPGRAQELLERLGIETLAACFPSSLSGGELRRAALARALINDPDIVIADEPLASLDKESSSLVVDLLADLARQGKAVLMVSHATEGLRNATQVLTLTDGQLTPSLKKDPTK